MSSALAIGAVSAVIKDLLDSGMIDHKAADHLGRAVAVTARAPDLIPLTQDQGASLNLFLYQVTPNPAWRNADLPARDAQGQRTSNPPLALDLHYLVTAYASTDFHAEILLGYAMQVLHETPGLSRDAIRIALNPPDAPVDLALPSAPVLAAADLADQSAPIRVTPEMLSGEEMSRLWSALQSRYRPSVAYCVSVVLIQSTAPARTSLPVLRRRITAQPDLLPPFPTIRAIDGPVIGAPVRPGELLTLEGWRFEGSNPVLHFAHARLPTAFGTLPVGTTIAANRIVATLPDDADHVPAGHVFVSASFDEVDGDGNLRTRTSNAVAVAVEPRFTALPAPAFARDADLMATLDLPCAPKLQPGQQVSLMLGSLEVPAERFATATSTPRFLVPDAKPGTFRVRLRVDGVDSRLVDRSKSPPEFVANQQVTIA